MLVQAIARGLVLLTLSGASACAHSVDGPPRRSEGAVFVDEFLQIMDEHSMFAPGAQWSAISARARTQAALSTDALSTYGILETVINEVGDEHGGLNVSDERTAEYQRRFGGLWYELTSRSPDSQFMNRETPSVEDAILANGRASVRIIVVPRVFTSEDEQAYARALFAATSVTSPDICGFVIDLRGNIGGDMWPMLAGLSPLLGDGIVGAFTSRAAPEHWKIERGSAGVEDDAASFGLTDWRAPDPSLASAPVAVLLDDGVLSSGEAVAVAFSGRALTRSFGHRTYGLSTANSPFPLSDGSTLYIATGVYRDRLERDFPHGVTPDLEVDPAGAAAPALREALAWMSVQAPCARY